MIPSTWFPGHRWDVKDSEGSSGRSKKTKPKRHLYLQSSTISKKSSCSVPGSRWLNKEPRETFILQVVLGRFSAGLWVKPWPALYTAGNSSASWADPSMHTRTREQGSPKQPYSPGSYLRTRTPGGVILDPEGHREVSHDTIRPIGVFYHKSCCAVHQACGVPEEKNQRVPEPAMSSHSEAKGLLVFHPVPADPILKGSGARPAACHPEH